MICHRHLRRAGAPLCKSSRLSPNSAAGNTAGIATTSSRPHGFAQETGDGDIRRFFNSASALHENFYENTMQDFEVADSLDDVAALLDKLLPLLDQT